MSPCHPKSIRRGAFTLMELIVVTTVIGILLSLAVPAMFSNLLSKSLSASAATLTGVLDEARWTAIQKRTYTRVIFPVESSPEVEARLGRRIANTSFIVVMWDRQLEEWKPVSAWRHLPESIGFENDDDPATLPIDPLALTGGLISEGADTVDDVDFTNDGEPDEIEAAAITFFADGSCRAFGPDNGGLETLLIVIAGGERASSGDFIRKRENSFRALAVSCASGGITEVSPK